MALETKNSVNGIAIETILFRLCELSPITISIFGVLNIKSKLGLLLGHLPISHEDVYSGEWVKCLFESQQSDNYMINAALTALTPKCGVAFGSCRLGFILKVQASYYTSAQKSKKESLALYWTGYEILSELTQQFSHMPTITIPINLGNHWGMCFVIPEPSTGGASIFWEDSLGWDPPSGLLKLLRAILALLYRDAALCIDDRNYMLSVLRFERQRDSHSCGFYMIAACSTFAESTTHESEVPGLYTRYSSQLTERYRQFCFDVFVNFIQECSTNVSHVLRTVQETMDLQRRAKVTVTNAALEMYADDEGRDSLLRVDDCVSAHDAVEDIDQPSLKPKQHGIYSLTTAAVKPRPMVCCKLAATCSGIPMRYADLIVRDTTECNTSTTTEAGDAKRPTGSLCQEIPQFPDDHPSNCFYLDDQERCGPPLPTRESLSAPPRDMPLDAEGVLRTPGKESTELVSNFFAYIETLLRAGHHLGLPYIKAYVNKQWLIRVRLRCRRYKAPKKKGKPNKEYNRCQARLIAQLRKRDGLWEMRFSSEHNHMIEASALLREAVESILLRMEESIVTHYKSIRKEYQIFQGKATFHPAIQIGAGQGPGCPRNPECGNGWPFPIAKRSASVGSGQVVSILPAVSENINNDGLCLSVPSQTPKNDRNILLDAKDDEREPHVLKLQLKDTVESYLDSIDIAADGQDLLRELKHILECFGFPMKIRRSSYFPERNDRDSRRRQLLRATFICPSGVDNLLKEDCRFKFTVFTTADRFFKGTEEDLKSYDDIDKM